MALAWAKVADMSNASATVLCVYIVLLLAGGLMGFIKAGSKVSLITSAVSAALLGLCVWSKMVYPAGGIILALNAVFTIRYNKTRKFMPAGLMVILSLVTLVALCLLR